MLDDSSVSLMTLRFDNNHPWSPLGKLNPRICTIFDFMDDGVCMSISWQCVGDGMGESVGGAPGRRFGRDYNGFVLSRRTFYI